MYHSNKQAPPPFFHLDINNVLGHVLIYFVDKTHVPVVTAELIWLLFRNILSFNFVPTPNNSLWLTRFRIYVNRPAVILTNHTSYAFFLLDMYCAVQSCHVPVFCSCLSPVHLRNLFLLSTPVAQMLLTTRWVSKRKDVK